MNAILEKNLFFVKEHVGMFKAANNFDIYDPDTQSIVLECREENLGFFTKMFRFTKYKRYTPFNVQVKTSDGSQMVRVKRNFSLLRSVVEVFDENNHAIGKFRQKLLSIGGAFTVLDTNDNEVCQLRGKWTSWDFRFMAGERELAHVAKKWAGLGKEMFTSADNYMLEIANTVPADDYKTRQLILASVMCIDMVLKE